MLNGNGCVLKATRSFFILLQSRLVLVSAGETRGGGLGFTALTFDIVDFFDHFRDRMPT